jgi:hypothetical protein
VVLRVALGVEPREHTQALSSLGFSGDVSAAGDGGGVDAVSARSRIVISLHQMEHTSQAAGVDTDTRVVTSPLRYTYDPGHDESRPT